MSPRHTPTSETRAKVSSLISFGVTQAEIAKHLGISHDTLENHYRYELDNAQIVSNEKVASSLFKKATEGNDLSAQIFWLKTRARWRSEDSKTIVESNEQLKEELRKLRDELDAQNKKEY